MNVTIIRLKKFAVALVALPMLTILVLNSASTPTGAAVTQEAPKDVAAAYKAKCAMCHGANAEKSFDATKSEAQHVEAILKGVKPKMPAYETKGIDEAQAKALNAFMKQRKEAAAAAPK